jgi:hypothetical protein
MKSVPPVESVALSGKITNWDRPLGIVPIMVPSADLAAEFKALPGTTRRVLSAYKIDIPLCRSR